MEGSPPRLLATDGGDIWPRKGRASVAGDAWGADDSVRGTKRGEELEHPPLDSPFPNREEGEGWWRNGGGWRSG